MRISPRFISFAVLAAALASCSSLEKPSKFAGCVPVADAFSQSGERLRDEIREYLKDEDRWIPKGRDISLWQAAESVAASGRNINDGLTNTRITEQELGALISTANKRVSDLEYWTANVRINESIIHGLGEVRSCLGTLQRSSHITNLNRPPAPANRSTFFSPQTPFSPNDLNSAVHIAKAYLESKYGIKAEQFGNMRANERSNHHEVILEALQTRYVLLVDTRKGVVLKETSSPKLPRRRLASL